MELMQVLQYQWFGAWLQLFDFWIEPILGNVWIAQTIVDRIKTVKSDTQYDPLALTTFTV